MIMISACLAGLNVRYDGWHCLQPKLAQMVANEEAITVCPEVLGELSIPRDPAEIVGGDGYDVLDGKAKVVTNKGKDVTAHFLKGAQLTLQKALEVGATTVILKENSPSCGSEFIYNGEFNGSKRMGVGVTAALLKRNGIDVISEQQFLNNNYEFK